MIWSLINSGDKPFFEISRIPNHCALEHQPAIARAKTLIRILSFGKIFFFHRTGMSNYVTLQPQNVSPSGRSEARRRQFFSDVNCATLDKLYQIYRMDFELFGYKFLEI